MLVRGRRGFYREHPALAKQRAVHEEIESLIEGGAICAEKAQRMREYLDARPGSYQGPAHAADIARQAAEAVA